MAIAGTAPSVSMTDTLTGAAYQAKFGLATASGQFASGSAAGDFVISNQAGNILWAYNSVEKMRLNSNGTVSIGNTNNTYNLDVTGTGRFTGTTYIGTGSANSSLVFKTGGSTNYSGSITTDSNVDTLIINGGSSATYNSGAQITLVGADRYGTSTAGYLTLSGGNASSNASYGYVSINTANTERFRITYGGNIGIGTSSPAASLDIYLSSVGTYFRGGSDNTARQLKISSSTTTNAGDTHTFDAQSGTGNLVFSTTSTERMRITSAGNVGIGTSSPSGALHVSAAASTIMGTFNAPTSGYGFHQYQYNGTTYGWIGQGSAIVSGGGATDMAISYQNNLIFSSGASTERMRITSYGSVCFGVTNSPGSNPAYKAAFTDAIAMSVNTNGNNMVNFFNGSGTYVSSIVVNSSTVNYNTSSDYRLKTDLKDFSGLGLISNIKVYDFAWKVDNTRTHGVIAHELQEVLPDAVTGEKDALDNDGNIKNQGVDYSKIVPVLVKSIQELNQTIQQQQKQINSLINK